MEVLEVRHYLATVSIESDGSVQEGTGGGFTVHTDTLSSSPLTVHFYVTGSATEVADFSPIGTSVVIPANAASVDIDIDPIADPEMEPTESVKLTLKADAAYVIGSAFDATLYLTHCSGFFAEPPDLPGPCPDCGRSSLLTDVVNSGNNGFWNPGANGFPGSSPRCLRCSAPTLRSGLRRRLGVLESPPASPRRRTRRTRSATPMARCCSPRATWSPTRTASPGA